MLNLNFILVLAVVVFSLLLSFFVFLRNWKNSKNKIYFIFSFSLSIWLLSAFLSDYIKNESYSLFWTQISLAFAPIFVSAFLHFSLVFSKTSQKTSFFKKFFIYAPVWIIEPLVFAGYIIKFYKPENWGINYGSGALSLLLAVFIAGYLFAAIIILFNKKRKARGLERLQIQYCFYAILGAILIGIFVNGTLFFGDYSYSGIARLSLPVLFLNLTIAYAILRYRLLGVRAMIQKALVYLISASYLILIYFVLVYVLENLTLINFKILSVVAGLFSSFLTVFSLKYINIIVKNATSPILFKNRYNFSEVLDKLDDALSNGFKLEEMLDKSFAFLKDALQIEKIALLLYDKESDKFIAKKSLGFNSDIKLELNTSNSLYKYLKKSKAPIISEEIELKLNDGVIKDSEKKIAEKTVENLKEWGADVCQPVIKRQDIIGFICVGEKISGNIFNEEDLKLIDVFASQLVFLVENFLVFSEVEAKKEQLEKNMSLMVGRELKMRELKNKIKELEAQISN